MDSREAFRGLIESDGIVVAPGVYDGISARLVEDLGFEAAFISGAAVSNARLGKPDFGIMNLTENADQTRTIAEAVDIPVQVDADTGYGNAVNVHHTVETLEDTGVASVMIEDQQWPKRCGHMQGKSVIPKQSMVRKIEAAVDARSDPNFLIKARTDSAGTHDIEEAVERLNAYAEAGADLLFADALLSEEDFEFVAEHTDAPLSVNMGYGIRERPTSPLMSPATLEDLGVKLVIYPRLITGAAVKGMENALETLKESVESGEVIKRPDQTVGFEEYTNLMDLPEVHNLEEKFADQ